MQAQEQVGLLVGEMVSERGGLGIRAAPLCWGADMVEPPALLACDCVLLSGGVWTDGAISEAPNVRNMLLGPHDRRGYPWTHC